MTIQNHSVNFPSHLQTIFTESSGTQRWKKVEAALESPGTLNDFNSWAKSHPHASQFSSIKNTQWIAKHIIPIESGMVRKVAISAFAVKCAIAGMFSKNNVKQMNADSNVSWEKKLEATIQKTAIKQATPPTFEEKLDLYQHGLITVKELFQSDEDRTNLLINWEKHAAVIEKLPPAILRKMLSAIYCDNPFEWFYNKKAQGVKSDEFLRFVHKYKPTFQSDWEKAMSGVHFLAQSLVGEQEFAKLSSTWFGYLQVTTRHLKELSPDQLEDLLSERHAKGETILHDPEMFDFLWPIVESKLSDEQIFRVLSIQDTWSRKTPIHRGTSFALVAPLLTGRLKTEQNMSAIKKLISIKDITGLTPLNRYKTDDYTSTATLLKNLPELDAKEIVKIFENDWPLLTYGGIPTYMPFLQKLNTSQLVYVLTRRSSYNSRSTLSSDINFSSSQFLIERLDPKTLLRLLSSQRNKEIDYFPLRKPAGFQSFLPLLNQLEPSMLSKFLKLADLANPQILNDAIPLLEKLPPQDILNLLYVKVLPPTHTKASVTKLAPLLQKLNNTQFTKLITAPPPLCYSEYIYKSDELKSLLPQLQKLDNNQLIKCFKNLDLGDPEVSELLRKLPSDQIIRAIIKKYHIYYGYAESALKSAIPVLDKLESKHILKLLTYKIYIDPFTPDPKSAFMAQKATSIKPLLDKMELKDLITLYTMNIGGGNTYLHNYGMKNVQKYLEKMEDAWSVLSERLKEKGGAEALFKIYTTRNNKGQTPLDHIGLDAEKYKLAIEKALTS